MALKQKHMDMTSGNIWRQLAVYAVPILLGELLQQLYNIVDIIVLGNYVSAHAMAAVGATGNVTKLIVGFFNGISVGCTVVVAGYFGSKNAEKLRQSVSNIIYLSFALGIVLSLAGVLITKPLLQLLSTPPEVMPLAVTYIRIYFAGMLGMVLFNTSTGILRAVGDSKRPLNFLIFSSVLNTVLDILVVVVFNFGVAGVAYTTIFSQGLSALMCLMLLARSKEDYRFCPREVRFNKEIVVNVLNIGVPTGFQRILTSLSNIIVLSYISFFGASCLAGWAVYTKVSHFIVVAIQSVGSAVTTFVSQNNGAGQYGRSNKGVSAAFVLAVFLTVVLSFITFVFCNQITRFFGSDADMLHYARLFVSGLILLQIIHVPNTIYSSALRGYGRAMSATVFLLAGLIGMRQLYLTIVKQFANTPMIVGLAFPAGWLSAAVMLYLYYRRTCKRPLP